MEVTYERQPGENDKWWERFLRWAEIEPRDQAFKKLAEFEGLRSETSLRRHAEKFKWQERWDEARQEAAEELWASLTPEQLDTLYMKHRGEVVNQCCGMIVAALPAMTKRFIEFTLTTGNANTFLQMYAQATAKVGMQKGKVREFKEDDGEEVRKDAREGMDGFSAEQLAELAEASKHVTPAQWTRLKAMTDVERDKALGVTGEGAVNVVSISTKS